MYFKNDFEKESTSKNITNSLKSENSYDASSARSKLMNVKPYKVLIPDTVLLKIKECGVLLVTVAILIFTILLFWAIYSIIL